MENILKVSFTKFKTVSGIMSPATLVTNVSLSYSSLQNLLPPGSQKVGERLYLDKSPGPDCIPPRISKVILR